MKIRLQPPRVVIKNFLVICTIGFAYVLIGMIYLFSFYITFTPGLIKELLSFKPASQWCIGIIADDHRLGEVNLAHDLQQSGEKLGWASYIFLYPHVLQFIPVLNLPIHATNYVLKYALKPQFNLVVTHHAYLLPPSPAYMFISVPPSWLMNKYGNLAADLSSVTDYAGYIDINLCAASHPDAEWLANLHKTQNKEPAPAICLTVPVQETIYQPCKPKKLTVFGGNFGKLKSSARYQSMFAALAAKGYTEFYGPKKAWQHLGANYKGLLAPYSELLTKLHENCMGLVIHSEDHIAAGIATARIMEVIASGAVAISDDNAFIKQVFGDNVLYFDHTASAEEMVRQIDNHVQWILSHPEEAAIKARKAHAIFTEQFTSEKFLLAVQKMHLTRGLTQGF